MVTVTNTGDVSTSANFRCYVDGEDADTQPSTLTTTVGPGESKDIPIVWYMYDAGMQSLDCKAFLPASFDGISELLTDLNGTSSDEINWVYAEEVEGTPFIIYIVAVLAFMGLAIVISRQNLKPSLSEGAPKTTPVIEDELKDETTETKDSVYTIDEEDES